MKRINLTIEEDLYEQVRKASFLSRKPISAIIRDSLNEWFINHSFSKKGELLLATEDENEILKIIEENDFMLLDTAKSELNIS